MPTYSVSKTFAWEGQLSDKAVVVMRMFGLTVDRLADKGVNHNCTVEINAGDILYITGPSGSGKSVLLGELEESIPASEKVNLKEIELPADKLVIDCIGGDFLKGLKLLSTAGLNDVFCVLHKPANLSDGQKWRFRLAMALASGKKFIFADEFCSELDQVTAAVIAYNIYKFAKQTGVTFVLASSHEDILLDLSPDVLVARELSGPTQVIYKKRNK
ncbi:MAG: ATP-binding cassette domain-containing protein [Planctomycetota bacterium]|jgi:ABC-type ATPase with predicted acetyltransferase domain